MNVAANSSRFLPEQTAEARRIFFGLEKAFVVFSFIYLTNGFIVRFLLEANLGSALSNLNLLIYFGSMILYAIHQRGRRLTLTVLLGVAPFIVLTFVSMFWSIDPSHSLREAIAFLGITMFGLYITVRFNFETILNLISISFGFLIIGSFLMGAGAPSLGIDSGPVHSGAWLGGFTHKNELGVNAAFSVLIFALRARYAKKAFNSWLYWGLALLALTLVLLSTSSTSLVVSIASLTMVVLLYVLRGRRAVVVAFGLFAIVAGTIGTLVLISNLEEAADLLGKDLTLTGRTRLWSESLEDWSERPWLGYGMEAFWIEDSPRAEQMRAKLNWDIPHSHNGAIDLLLDLGVVGLTLGLGLYLLLLFKALRFFQRSRSPLSLWPLLFLLFILMINLTETNFVKQKSIYWVFIVVLANFPYLQRLQGRVGVHFEE